MAYGIYAISELSVVLEWVSIKLSDEKGEAGEVWLEQSECIVNAKRL